MSVIPEPYNKDSLTFEDLFDCVIYRSENLFVCEDTCWSSLHKMQTFLSNFVEYVIMKTKSFKINDKDTAEKQHKTT